MGIKQGSHRFRYLSEAFPDLDCPKVKLCVTTSRGRGICSITFCSHKKPPFSFPQNVSVSDFIGGSVPLSAAWLRRWRDG